MIISYRGEVEVLLDSAERGPEGDEESGPDDDRPELVQHGPGGGVHLLGHGDPGPVEDSNGAHVAQGPAQQPVVVLVLPSVALVTVENHHEGVNCVLEPRRGEERRGGGREGDLTFPPGPERRPP